MIKVNSQKTFNSLILPLLLRNYIFAKKLNLGFNPFDRFIIAIFLTSIFFTIILLIPINFSLANMLFPIDIKLVSLVIFILFSAFLLLKFMSKNAYEKYIQSFESLSIRLGGFLLFVLIIILIYVFSMIYNLFWGNLSSALKYIQM